MYSCPDMNDAAAMSALGFDPLVANLLYLYGNALLYTYTATTGMFGDKAEAEVKKRAEARDAANANAADELMAQILDDATADLISALQAEEYGEEDGELEGEEGEEDGEDETIDADAEAARQEEAKVAEEEEEEAKKDTKKAEEAEEEGGEGAEAEENEQEGGENGENAEDDGEAENGENEGDKAAEPNDLELAWQVLELARVLYASQPNRKLELSDVHFSLGSVAFEDEKPEDAKAEFEKALKYAEEANNRRAQAQVLLLLSSIHETNNDIEGAVKELEKAKNLMKQEIEELKTNDPSVDIAALEESVSDIDARIFALNEKFVPVHPDDVKDLPDPSKGKVTFSFTAPTISSSSGPSTDDAAEGSAPVTVLQPKKKVKATETATTTENGNDGESSESRGQKRAAEDPIPVNDDTGASEDPSAKRAKAADE